MKESSRRMGKRLLSILLSASAAVGNFPALIQGSQLMQSVSAADAPNAADGTEQKNIVNILGMSTNKPDGFNEDDTLSNPYGKKKNRLAGSDEVYSIKTGEKEGFVFGKESSVGWTSVTNPTESNAKWFFSDHEAYINENGVDVGIAGFSYISEIGIACDVSVALTKSTLEGNGFKVIDYDINQGSHYFVYLGYKTTTDPSKAISGILIKTNTKDDTIRENGLNYKLATYDLRGNELPFTNTKGDTNIDNGNPAVRIYTTTDKDFNSRGTEGRKAIRALYVDEWKKEGSDEQSLNAPEGKECYLHWTEEYLTKVKPEGQKWTSADTEEPIRLRGDTTLQETDKSLPAVLKDNHTPTRTASGFFDARSDGKKTQYAMLTYNPGECTLDLGVYDAANPKAKSVTKRLGWYDPMTSWAPEMAAQRTDISLNLLYASAALNVQTGDFNNDGTDEIVVLNPKNASGEAEVEVYFRRNTPDTVCTTFDDTSWSKKTVNTYPLGTIPSISVGDANNDGFDDLLISVNGHTDVYLGSASPFVEDISNNTTASKRLELDSSHPRPQLPGRPEVKGDVVLQDTSAVVFTKKNDDNQTVETYIAVLGFQSVQEQAPYGEKVAELGNYVLILYRYDSKEKTFFEDGRRAFDKETYFRGSRYELAYDIYTMVGGEYKTTTYKINFPTDLHCMNGMMFSRWLYETCLITGMDFDAIKKEVTIETCSSIHDDERILTNYSGALTRMPGSGSVMVGERDTGLLNAYCYDFQTAVLNSNEQPISSDRAKALGDENKKTEMTSAITETTFYKYIRCRSYSDMTNALGAYTAGHIKDTSNRKPEMSPCSSFYYSPYGQPQSLINNPVMYVILDTDDDSCSVTYTGKHWYQYSDPEILAVLSAPPYFKDLAAIDPGYAGSTTGFEKSQSQSQGVTESFNMKFGGYVKFTPELKIFGVKIMGFETEIHSLATFTQGYSNVTTQTFTVGYETSGADSVVFYSIPVECYEYTFTKNENGKTESATGIMYIPRQPSLSQKTLTQYRELCSYYPDMPKLDDNIVKHTVGEPSSYPKSEEGYVNPLVQKQLLNIDSNGEAGGQPFTQTIEIDSEISNEYSGGVEMSFIAGITSELGAVGVEGGTSVEAGTVSVNSTGLAFTTHIEKLPEKMDEEGYNFSTKLFVHNSNYTNKNGSVVTFPVVDYLVPTCSEPPHVPANFMQDYDASSADKVVMTWDYDAAEANNISFFTIYRMALLEGKKTAEPIAIATVGASDFVTNENGRKSYTYTDDGTNLEGGKIELMPEDEIHYVIRATSGSFVSAGSTSIASPEMIAFTHSNDLHPIVTLTGVYNNAVQMFPEVEHSVTAEIKTSSGDPIKGSVTYIWQKRNPKTGIWENLDEKYMTKSLPLHQLLEEEEHTFDAAGEYRCRITIQTSSTARGVVVYSDSFTMTEKLLTAKSTNLTAAVNDHHLNATVNIIPDDENSGSNSKSRLTPTGNVVFKLYQGDTLCLTCTANLEKTASRTGTASFDEYIGIEKNEEIVDKFTGIYQLVASYGGDKNYGSFDSEPINVLFSSDEICPITYRVDKNNQKELTNCFYYGDTMLVEFHRFERDEKGVITDKLITELEPISRLITEIPQDDAYTGNVSLGALANEQQDEITYSYYVKPINVTVDVKIPVLYEGEITTEPEPVKVAGEFRSYTVDGVEKTDSLEDLVSISYTTNADKPITKAFKDLPGAVYKTVLGVKQIANPDTTATDKMIPTPRAAYYKFTFINHSFRINNSRAVLKVTETDKGTVNISVPIQKNAIEKEKDGIKISGNSAVRMTAEPKIGYRLKEWQFSKTVKLAQGCSNTSETIQFTMEDSDLTVTAVFEEYLGKVLVDTDYIGGTVKYPEGFSNEKSYSVGTMLTFEMVGDDVVIPNYWAVDLGDGGKLQRIYDAEIKVVVAGTIISITPVFIGKPCMLTYSSELKAECLSVNSQDRWLNPIAPSGETIPKGSKLRITPLEKQISLEDPWVLNGKEIDFSKGYYDFVIDGDTVIQRKSEVTTTAEATTTTVTTTESSATSKTTESSAISKTTESSAISKTTESSAISKTTASSAISKTTASSATSKTTESSAISKTTESSATSKTTESSAISKTMESSATSKTTESSATSKTTESSATSKTTESSATSKTTESSATSKTTESSAASKSTESSATSKTTESATVPTETTVNAGVTTTGTTVSETKETTSSVTGEAGSTSTATETTTTTETTATKTVGDVNGDGSINLKDVVTLRRYIAGGWNVKIDEAAADINGDGSINLKDVVILRRFVASGWGIVLRALT